MGYELSIGRRNTNGTIPTQTYLILPGTTFIPYLVKDIG